MTIRLEELTYFALFARQDVKGNDNSTTYEHVECGTIFVHYSGYPRTVNSASPESLPTFLHIRFCCRDAKVEDSPLRIKMKRI